MKNNKVIVFCNLAGNINATNELKYIIKKENINLVVSLGNAIGLHDKVNECFDLIKDFVLIKFIYENILIKSDVPENIGNIKKIVLNKNIEDLQVSNKTQLSSMLEKFETDEASFSGYELPNNPNKLNFYYPSVGYGSKPFVVDLEKEIPINTPLPIHNFIGKGIYPGAIFFTGSEMGLANYCIFDDKVISFHEFNFDTSKNYYQKVWENFHNGR